MSMCPVFVLALVSCIALAIPLLSRQSQTVSPFVIRASQPGSPIHLSSLNASNGHFWFGKSTSSSCPTDLDPHCPMGSETTFVVSDDGSASLDAHVPGGQTVYVAKNGALSFTPAHEANVLSLAYPSGFSYSNGSEPTNGPAGYFTFAGTPSKDWLACPVAKGGPWQVFAFIRGASNQGCMEFEAQGEPNAGGAVWQYD